MRPVFCRSLFLMLGGSILVLAAAVLVGCNKDGGTRPPVAALDPATLDFGQVMVGQTADRSFTLSNAGGGTLSGTLVESCPEFSLVLGGGAFSLGAGQAREVTVRFGPTSAGEKACAVTIGDTSSRSLVCAGMALPIPTGACCASNGTCTIDTEANCASPGLWQGQNISCAPNPCPQPSGACCAADGACTVALEVGCTGFWTMFIPCDPNPCPQPTGSCCATDGSCTVTLRNECSGVWTMFASCDPNPCPQPTGSCCALDGTCSAKLATDCMGAWTMFGGCDPNPCPQPSGSCCLPAGTCAVTLRSDCSGAWTMFTACAPNPCPQPTGSCCAPDGACSAKLAVDCMATWTMFGVCSPNPCPQPSGSCCLPAGTCAVTLRGDCSGAWTMSGSCSPNPCPQPTGACCIATGTCTVTLVDACSGSWTMFEECDPNPCPQPTGACCATTGACALALEADCAGPWTMFGACAPNPCPQPTGACCTPTGGCAVAAQSACVSPNAWKGAGTSCLVNPCPQPTGACCAPTGVCAASLQSTCISPSSWQGAGSTCTPNPCPQPTGACCASNGACTNTTQESCGTPNSWQGASTSCSPNPCPQPTGACCASTGVCAVSQQSACISPSTWQGAGSTCAPNPCPQPTGACCASNGACTTTAQESCETPNSWQGASTNCSPNPCPQPTGACCASVGTCTETTAASCAPSGTWQGALTDCSPNPCVPTGACCTAAGTCAVTVAASCSSPSVWQGAGTGCSPNPCPQPTGACCAAVGTCTETSAASCAPSGTWQGALTDCSPNPCVPTGACCTAAGTCAVTIAASCSSPSVWQGPGTSCSPNPCPQPTGACCAPAGTCVVTPQASCPSPGTWRGAGTDCSPNLCPPPVITVNPGSLPGGTVGIPYSRTLTATGGTAPYTFDVSAGSLPSDLNLSPPGDLSGTPAAAGTSPFTAQATDAHGFTGSRAYSLTIASGGGLNLTLPAVYITQSTQTLDFGVPLVKDRDGLLRAFVIADGTNSVTPDVRVRIYNAGHVLVQTYVISAPTSSVPTAINESDLWSSWNQTVPGSFLQPDYSLEVDVDPSGLIVESAEGDNVWPPSGSPQTLDVRDLPVLEITFVPVNTPSGTGNVSAGNAASFLDLTRRVHPIPSYTSHIHTVMNSSATLGADGAGWSVMLSEVRALRTADGASGHYFGVVHVGYTSGVAGLGDIGSPVASGWDYLPSGSWTLAHEIGHNWNYRHTRCTGGEDQVDTGYPYANGIIGAYGYDLWAGTLKDRVIYKDVMSYCQTPWISDYTYKKILTYRESHLVTMREGIDGARAAEPCLLVWGRRIHGDMILEPSFHLVTRPSPPTPGPYRAEGLDSRGRTLWLRTFDLTPDDLPDDPTSAAFCFALPMTAELLDQCGTIRIVEGGTELARRSSPEESPAAGFRQTPAQITVTRSGAETTDLSWDLRLGCAVLVRDAERGEYIGFVRNGSARLLTSSRRLEALLSDGVHTRIERSTE